MDEEDWSRREAELVRQLKEQEDEAHEKIENLTLELDMLRNAFSGDSSGWEVHEGNSTTYYENTETGEVRDTEPEVLYIARAMRRVEEADSLAQQLAEMTKKFKDMEMKKREVDLQSNKLRTELNSIRLMDKQWKECAKVIFHGLNDVKSQFDAQADQILLGLSEVSKTSARIHANDPKVRSVEDSIIRYKKKIRDQEQHIEALNGQIRSLTIELEDQTDKVRRLSQGLEEEVNRLCTPMRKKLSDCMALVMQEKAARAQERRELAALWPEDHMMPSILMRHRVLSVEERERRKKLARDMDASRALAIEIRANVAESKMWEMKYDDYGRQFFEHKLSGKAEWTAPAIMQYKPPKGRDELGNLEFGPEANMFVWKMLADSKGQVYYKNKDTGEITYIPPDTLSAVPPAKSIQEQVGEAAMLVLSYIRGKITRHIQKMTNTKHELENPLSIQEKKKIAKAKAREIQLNGGVDPEETKEKEPDPDFGDDLSRYQYDIETVELLAAVVEEKGAKSGNPAQEREAKRAFLAESSIRNFDVTLFAGPRVVDTDLEEITTGQIRDIVSQLATSEEKLEQRLIKTRENLKDFSFILMDRLREDEEKRQAEEEEKRREKEEEEREMQEAAEALARGEEPGSEAASKSASRAGTPGQNASRGTTPGQNKSRGTTPKTADTTRSGATSSGLGDTEPPPEGAAAVAEASDENSMGGNDDFTVTSELTNPYELKQKDASTVGFLLGDPALEDVPLSEQPNSIVSSTDSLADLAIFCGYANIHIDELPNDCTQEVSLYPDNNNIVPDDQWFTKSFFISLTPEKVELLNKMTTKQYDPVLGLSPEGNLSTAALLQLRGKDDISEGGARDGLKPYTSSASRIHESMESNYRVWKAKQLMTEVLMWQLQKEAVSEALAGKLLDGDGVSGASSLNASRLSIVPTKTKIKTQFAAPIELKVVKLVAIGVSQKVWADQQRLFVRLSLGGWVARSATNTATGQDLGWDDTGIRVLIPRENIQMDDLKVEVFEENIMLDDRRLCAGKQSIRSVLGHNLGRDMTFEVHMKARKDVPGGIVKVTINADFNKEMAPRDLDPDSLLGVEVNYSPNTLEPFPVVAGERDKRTPIIPEEIRGGVDMSANRRPASGGLVDGEAESKGGEDSAADGAGAGAGAGAGGGEEGDGEGDNDKLGEMRSVASSQNKRDRQVSFSEVDGEAASESKGDSLTKNEENDNSTLQSDRRSEDDINSESTGRASKQRGGNKGEEDVLSGVFPSLADQQSTFGGVVSNLRGEGDGLVRMLVGDVSLNDIWKLGHRTGEGVLKRLPDFRVSKTFLRVKTRAQRKEIDGAMSEIEKAYTSLEEVIAAKLEAATVTYAEVKKKYQSQLDGAVGARDYVKTVMDQLDGLRNPLALPKEPVFEPFGDLVRVYQIPKIAALDERGKKKKKLSIQEVQQWLDRIERGELDGQDWDFGDLCPSTPQIAKLTEAIAARNLVLEEIRAAEEAQRGKAYAAHKEELNRWDKDERVRKLQLEKVKKESRKAFLRLQGFDERADRLSKEFKALETDMATMTELKEMHEKSIERFKIMRMKMYLENDRRNSIIKELKLRMLKALDARKRAIEAPGGATNDVNFAELSVRSEESLRLLRVDVFTMKQTLVNEGVRMRHFFEEEVSIYRAELNRVRIFREIVNQRACIDKILARNRYEIIHLYEDLDKLRVIEAGSDDRGVSNTVDGKGERYTLDKVWESPGAVECLRLIDMLLAKITLYEGACSSAGEIQKHLLHSVSVRWSVEMIPVRDCWIEQSDYERSRGMIHDVVKWLAIQRQRLKIREKEREQEVEELRLQLATAQEQIDIGLKVQDFETTSMVDSTATVVGVLQKILDEQRQHFHGLRTQLEASIGELSKECQSIREELFNQKLVFDERTKILWAVIGTLQATVQQMSVKMEILTEERDRTVLTSKLMSDKLRHQLRVERKHCANLLFIIHAQRGYMNKMDEMLRQVKAQKDDVATSIKEEKNRLRREIWEQLFVFTRMSTDVDSLFEFFAARLANLAGARRSINDALARNGASSILAAMCRSPRLMIRKWASRALGNMGWDGYIETRVILWDCVMYWKMYKSAVLAREREECERGFKGFSETGRYESILNIDGRVEEFAPSGNVSLRTIIKQRRQWALRAVRRNEGPNDANLKIINVQSGAIPALLELCLQFGESDWEVARNCALAICIASYETQNHRDMVNEKSCVDMIVRMCGNGDIEVRTHAAVTLANLCHNDERAQVIIGNTEAIPILLKMCESTIVDLLEAATCALSNITSFCDRNCRKVIEADGVVTMLRLITQPYTENLLDMDQNDEVQANAAEMLANVSRFNFDKIPHYFDGKVIDSLIFMSTAKNLQVRRHAPLVLGNISQDERCRAEIGERGGVEALILILEDEDVTVQANSMWALCNLMWHPPNQAHAGRFTSEIIAFFNSPYLPVKINSVILIANVLYYNNPNRIRFLESEGAMEQLLDFIRARNEPSLVEASLRAVLSLSYVDYVAMWLGAEAKAVPLLISYLNPPYLTRNCMQYALEIICNLCVHHVNRRLILEHNGIDALVYLHADDELYVQQLSVHVIEYLEDVTPAEILARRKQEIGLERMVTLATDADPLVRTIAAESIGEEVWHDPSKQKRAAEVGAVDALLAILNNPDEAMQAILPALWSLRNLMHENPGGQAQFAYRDGVYVVVSTISRCVTGRYEENTEQILEACLACLVSAIFNDQTNSYRLLVVGLDAMMDLADCKIPQLPDGGFNPFVRRAMQSEGVISLAKSILLMMGPYNFIVCRNCSRKQDLLGTSCIHCGHRLRVEVIEKDMLTINPKTHSHANGSVTVENSKSITGTKGLRKSKMPKTTDPMRSSTS